MKIELVDAADRTVTSSEIVARWRAKAGRIPGAESLSFSAAAHGPGGSPVEFKLAANRRGAQDLDEVVERVKESLADLPGVFDISDDSLPGKWEFRLRIKDEAMAMGVRSADLAETVRATYYGQEVVRLQRGRHEVKLMVRYPQHDRHSLAASQAQFLIPMAASIAFGEIVATILGLYLVPVLFFFYGSVTGPLKPKMDEFDGANALHTLRHREEPSFELDKVHPKEPARPM